MLSDLHGVGIKLKTTQLRVVWNTIKIRIVIEFSTEYGQFWVLFILSLVLLSSLNFRFNQLYPLTPLMEKLDAFTRLSIKLRISGETWKNYHSTLVHQQYIGRTAQILFLFLKLK